MTYRHRMPSCATACHRAPPHAIVRHRMPSCATACHRAPPHAIVRRRMPLLPVAQQDGHHSRAVDLGYDEVKHPGWHKQYLAADCANLFVNWHPAQVRY
jgi:hypothetical protein